MSDRVFVDTNILVYAHDQSTGHKYERARALLEGLWSDGTGAVSTQVLQELSITLRRKIRSPLDWAGTYEILQDYLTWHVVVNDGKSILEAMNIERRFGIGFWDALIVHAAEAAGASILYSEDLSHGQTYGSVRVVNPFHAAPHKP